MFIKIQWTTQLCLIVAHRSTCLLARQYYPVLVNVALWESQDPISAPTSFFFRGFGDCVWSHLLNSGMKSAGFSQRLS